jgi:plastocyanin
VGLVALAVSFFVHDAPPPAKRPRVRPPLYAGLGLAWGVAATVVLAAAPSMVTVPAAKEGQLVVGIKNSRFTESRLDSKPGRVTIVVANPDLFWHTFTVPDLHIDVTVPVGSVREASALLEPGRYDYVCRVPGHTRMIGVLVVA